VLDLPTAGSEQCLLAFATGSALARRIQNLTLEIRQPEKLIAWQRQRQGRPHPLVTTKSKE
jgi:hypothetical protein